MVIRTHNNKQTRTHKTARTAHEVHVRCRVLGLVDLGEAGRQLRDVGRMAGGDAVLADAAGEAHQLNRLVRVDGAVGHREVQREEAGVGERPRGNARDGCRLRGGDAAEGKHDVGGVGGADDGGDDTDDEARRTSQRGEEQAPQANEQRRPTPQTGQHEHTNTKTGQKSGGAVLSLRANVGDAWSYAGTKGAATKLTPCTTSMPNKGGATGLVHFSSAVLILGFPLVN